ncbi:MAG: SGNH/GDSL hydrolase family protein [Eubacteriales bacterium]|nr:SGNH/GDSL hydrolase family protein [Eubacteriales bacterium]
MTTQAIHIWGDSIGKGIIFDEARSRYSLTAWSYADQIKETFGIPVHNHARMGATVIEGLKTLQTRGFDEQVHQDEIIAIEYGGNDCDLNWAQIADNPEQDHSAKVPLPIFREKLMDFVQLVRKSGGRPVLVTPPPLEATRYFNWVTKGLNATSILKFIGDVQHIYRWQERYALVVRDVAQKTGCELFDIRDHFLSNRHFADLLCVDGIHPNQKGQALITQLVLQKLALWK